MSQQETASLSKEEEMITSVVRRITSPFLKDHQQDTGGVNHPPNETTSSMALVILNSPIATPSPLFDALWEQSTVRVCADGGANRLYHARPLLTPDWIVGDLDSVHGTVLQHYTSTTASNSERACRIERIHDQDYNDLDKALQVLSRRSSSTSPPILQPDNEKPAPTKHRHVVVYGAFGGRFDQEMASMQALFKWTKVPEANGDSASAAPCWEQLWLYDDYSCACLILPQIQHSIQLDSEWEGPTCGLIPLGGKCDCVSTSGLQWDLHDQPLEFGGLVSTSNCIVDDKTTTVDKKCRRILVWTSHPLVFTAQVHSKRTSNDPWNDDILKS